MMAVRYHGCTCHLRYSAAANQNQNQNSVKKGSDNSNTSGKNLFLYGQFSIQSIIDFKDTQYEVIIFRDKTHQRISLK